jgi:hypothetical protein
MFSMYPSLAVGSRHAIPSGYDEGIKVENYATM